jgi:hypothetical protein
MASAINRTVPDKPRYSFGPEAVARPRGHTLSLRTNSERVPKVGSLSQCAICSSESGIAGDSCFVQPGRLTLDRRESRMHARGGAGRAAGLARAALDPREQSRPFEGAIRADSAPGLRRHAQVDLA